MKMNNNAGSVLLHWNKIPILFFKNGTMNLKTTEKYPQMFILSLSVVDSCKNHILFFFVKHAVSQSQGHCRTPKNLTESCLSMQDSSKLKAPYACHEMWWNTGDSAFLIGCPWASFFSVPETGQSEIPHVNSRGPWGGGLCCSGPLALGCLRAGTWISLAQGPALEVAGHVHVQALNTTAPPPPCWSWAPGPCPICRDRWTSIHHETWKGLHPDLLANQCSDKCYCYW